MHCSGFPFVYNRRRLIYDSVDIPSVTASPQDLIYVLGSIIESAFFGGVQLVDLSCHLKSDFAQRQVNVIALQLEA
jgi:hypothetical protein